MAPWRHYRCPFWRIAQKKQNGKTGSSISAPFSNIQHCTYTIRIMIPPKISKMKSAPANEQKRDNYEIGAVHTNSISVKSTPKPTQIASLSRQARSMDCPRHCHRQHHSSIPSVSGGLSLHLPSGAFGFTDAFRISFTLERGWFVGAGPESHIKEKK